MKLAIWGNELTTWVTAGLLAQAGNSVFMVCDDTESMLFNSFSSGLKKEPGLNDLIHEEHSKERLQMISADEAYAFETHIISLNPSEFITAKDIVANIARNVDQCLVINQSHFGVGKTDELQALMPKDTQTLCYYAESISEGVALQSATSSKAITLGLNQSDRLPVVRSLLKPFTSNLEQFLIMTTREAEFSKFSVTGMLALRLGYINELANLAEQLDVDIDVIRQSMGADPRIGHHYLSPGCGFGGNIFSQTLKELSNLLVEKRQSQLLDTVLIENENQKEQPFRKLWRHYQCDIRGKNIAIWGASFKPGSSALDGAPSLKVINAIISQQASVRIHDPEALENIANLYSNSDDVIPLEDKYATLENADALILLTEWPEYWSPDYEAILEHMRTPIIIDGRNVFDRELLESFGFTYYGVGR